MQNLDVFATSALGTLAQVTIKSSLIVLLAAGVNGVLRRRNAALRHLVWTAALASAIVIALSGAVLPAWHIVPVPHLLTATIYGDTSSKAAVSSPAPEPASFAPSAPTPQTTRSQSRPTYLAKQIEAAPVLTPASEQPATQEPSTPLALAQSSRPTNWRVIMLALWVLGAAAMLARYLVSTARVRALLRRSERVLAQEWLSLEQRVSSALGITRPVTLLTSDHVDVPITCGVIYPRVVLPASAAEWTLTRRHAVLSHELAHVKRFDAATQWIAFAASVLCWFNPLVWYAARQMRFERERACDDFVLASGARASEYASDLLAIVSSLSNSETYHVALAMARPSQFEGRLLALLDAKLEHKYLTRGALAIVTVIALAVLIPVGAAQVAVPQPPMPPPSAQPPSVPEPVDAPAAPSQPVDDVRATAAPAPLPDTIEQPTSPAPVSTTPIAAQPAPPAQRPNAVAIATPAPAAVRSAAPSQIQAPAPAPPAAPAAPAGDTIIKAHDTQSFASGVFAPCRSGGEHRNVNISNSDSDGDKSWTVTVRGANCDIDLRARGNFRFKPDLTGIEYVGPDSYVKMSSKIAGESNELDARPGNGGLALTYSRNGQRIAMDARANEWLRDFLVELERSSAFAVETRVPQLLAHGGPARVLQETAQMNDYPRATYIAVLMKKAQLSPSDAREVVRQASQTSSDYYSAQMLTAIAEKYSLDDPNIGAAFTDAINHINSDYYHAQVMSAFLNKNKNISASQANALLRSTMRINSDYYIAQVLKQMADKRLVSGDAWPVYLESAQRMHSDYYLTEVLTKLFDSYSGDPSVVERSILAAQGIGSDYYKLQVLRGARDKFKIEGRVRDAYMKIARTIGSDTYRKEALNGMQQGGVL